MNYLIKTGRLFFGSAMALYGVHYLTYSFGVIEPAPEASLYWTVICRGAGTFFIERSSHLITEELREPRSAVLPLVSSRLILAFAAFSNLPRT